MRGLWIAVFILFGGAAASAQELAPGTPDVVMQCFFNNKPSKGCTFSCGSELDQASGAAGGKRVEWTRVDRVEIFHRGVAGRTDTRSMLFARYFTEDASKKGYIVGLYIGPPVHCFWFGENKDYQNNHHELRIIKFNFN